MRQLFIYIMASHSRVLYIGVTNCLERRVHQHKQKAHSSFTAKYNVTRLVYYETFNEPRDAIARETQIKGWTRAKKIALIETKNPFWEDLSEELFGGAG
jgi:putative endonuclease